MSTIAHRLRPFLIGLVALLLTAGIAFAGKPATPAAGLTVAADSSGKTVPVQAQEDEDGDEDPDADEPAEPAEPAGDNGGANCATDPTGLSDEELATMRHGSIVCWAAHQETPDGYRNHGQFVSEWAKKNHGHASEHGKPPKP